VAEIPVGESTKTCTAVLFEDDALAKRLRLSCKLDHERSKFIGSRELQGNAKDLQFEKAQVDIISANTQEGTKFKILVSPEGRQHVWVLDAKVHLDQVQSSDDEVIDSLLDPNQKAVALGNSAIKSFSLDNEKTKAFVTMEDGSLKIVSLADKKIKSVDLKTVVGLGDKNVNFSPTKVLHQSVGGKDYLLVTAHGIKSTLWVPVEEVEQAALAPVGAGQALAPVGAGPALAPVPAKIPSAPAPKKPAPALPPAGAGPAPVAQPVGSTKPIPLPK
jgi:hypothetical protein